MSLTEEQKHRIKIARLKPIHLRSQEDFAYIQLDNDEAKKK